MFLLKKGDNDVNEIEQENRMEAEEPTVPEKGFYISFDEDATPKRPKPPLRVKRASPKKVQYTYYLTLLLTPNNP